MVASQPGLGIISTPNQRHTGGLLVEVHPLTELTPGRSARALLTVVVIGKGGYAPKGARIRRNAGGTFSLRKSCEDSRRGKALPQQAEALPFCH